MPEWSEVVLDKLRSGRAAPFYIVRASEADPKPRRSLLAWWGDFLARYRGQAGRFHPDVISIVQEEPPRDYKIESGDLDPFFEAQKFGPLELPCKVVVVADAERIPVRYANKMLKTLEEPQKNTAVFFLSGSPRPLLTTLESRALHFKLDPPEISPREKPLSFDWLARRWQDDPVLWERHGILLSDFLNNPKESHGLLNGLKSDLSLQKAFFEAVLEWHCLVDSDYLAVESLCRELRWFHYSKTFHNPTFERFLGVINQTF